MQRMTEKQKSQVNKYNLYISLNYSCHPMNHGEYSYLGQFRQGCCIVIIVHRAGVGVDTSSVQMKDHVLWNCGTCVELLV